MSEGSRQVENDGREKGFEISSRLIHKDIHVREERKV